jgi:hypothetical protein
MSAEGFVFGYLLVYCVGYGIMSALLAQGEPGQPNYRHGHWPWGFDAPPLAVPMLIWPVFLLVVGTNRLVGAWLRHRAAARTAAAARLAENAKLLREEGIEP